MPRIRILVVLFVLQGFVGIQGASAQIYRVAEMNTVQLRELDRNRTVVILTGGILEQHGPYLPSFTDALFNEWITQRLAEAIVARPGWNVLLFPTIPLGTGGANEIGRKYVFPGTYAVSSTTLRSVFMDLVTELGEQGFRRGFIVHGHGAPNHNRILHQVSDYFRDTYSGEFVHLMGLNLPIEPAPGLTEAERKEDGLPIHSGALETSGMLFLHPQWVSPEYVRAPTQTATTFDDLVRLARAADWPGYFGSPKLATASRAGMLTGAAALVDYTLKILDGLDSRQFRVPNDELRSDNPVLAAISADALARELELKRRQEAWLKSKGIE